MDRQALIVGYGGDRRQQLRGGELRDIGESEMPESLVDLYGVLEDHTEAVEVLHVHS